MMAVIALLDRSPWLLMIFVKLMLTVDLGKHSARVDDSHVIDSSSLSVAMLGDITSGAFFAHIQR